MRFLILAVLTLAPAPAHAWGRVAHATVCEIAYQELLPGVRDVVDELIRLDPEFSRFSDSCSWADSPRKRAPEHYVNFERETRAAVALAPRGRNVIDAIQKDMRVLADPSAASAAKLEAIKFVGHWVGDVHQPFHASYGDDRGANAIEVRGLCRGTLHGAWDGCMVERGLGRNADALANELRSEIRAVESELWPLVPPLQWARESLALSQGEARSYCFRDESGCWYAADNRTYERGETKRIVTLDEVYLRRSTALIRHRLKQAGVRLAFVLNETLAR